MPGNLTLKEVAAELRISKRTLERVMAKTAGLTYLRVGRSLVFRPADVERLMAALAVSTSEPYRVTRTTRVITAREMKRSGETAREAIARKMAEIEEERRLRRELRKTLKNGWGGRMPTA